MSSAILRRLEALEASAGKKIYMHAAELGADGLLTVSIDGKRYTQAADEAESEFTSRLSSGRCIVATPDDVLL
jgi:hypothetical protein